MYKTKCTKSILECCISINANCYAILAEKVNDMFYDKIKNHMICDVIENGMI